MSPSICGSFLIDKRSLVAFTWTITTVLTLVAFVTSVVMMLHVHSHYKYMERYYEQQYEYNYNNNNNNNNGGNGEDGNEEDERGSGDAEREYEAKLQLSALSSRSISFVAVYTMTLAVALSIYGSTAIVGFTSLRGVYIAPCFSSSGSPKLRLGIFVGAIVFFANVLLVAAVVLGEVRIEDWSDNRRDDEEDDGDASDTEAYEVERIATILAVTCMFLSALYTIFAVLLFLYFGNEEADIDEEAVQTKSSAALPPMGTVSDTRNSITSGIAPSDPRRESFIVGRA